MSPAPAWENSPLPGPVNVVGSLVTPGQAALDQALAAGGCDVIEFRLDAFPQAVSEVRSALAASPLPVLITARDPKEGGLNALGRTPRHALLLSLLEEADLVDIEIANLGVFRDVVSQARESGIPVVGSFHEFRAMPGRAELDDLAAEGRSLGADIIKFALTLGHPEDLLVLTSLLEAAPSGQLSVMGMGPLGPVSRLLCGQFGSVLNYGYLDTATVPGQWPAPELKRLLSWLRS